MNNFRIVDSSGLPVQADLTAADHDVRTWAGRIGSGFRLQQRSGPNTSEHWVPAVDETPVTLTATRPVQQADLREGTGQLHLVGDLTIAGLSDLDQRLRHHTAVGGGVIDMSLVTFLPAAAAGLLHHHLLATALSAIEIRIVARSPCIASRVLTVLAVPHYQA